MMLNPQYTKGALLVLVLVFGAIFFIIISGFMTSVVNQSQLQERKYQQEQAREIAEAGLNYYKWYLAHNPNDATNGTGVPGPYVMPYSDPELGAIGEYSLEVSSSTFCGEVASIDITSTGYTYDEPSLTRSIYARYARPTVAEFAYIINANVWAGGDRTIVGPYHSNGYIRMDGTNNSTVTSGQDTWVCDNDQLTCDPPNNEGDTIDAVFGAGPNNSLWSFPSPPIDFNGLTLDLAAMKTKAQAGVGGIFIPNSGDFGYRVTFLSDGTVEVRNVDRTWSHYEYYPGDGWYTAQNLIRDDEPYATYTIDPSCPLIFVEDKVWLEGEVDQKVTIAVGGDGGDWSMVLHNNITYTSTSSGLLAIAEEDMIVGYDVPNDMELNGIFVAQNGRFGRFHYWNSSNGGDLFRDSLTINGTIVSNGGVGTQWVSGGTPVSGFLTRFNAYDRDLVNNPPPLSPNTSDDYKFVEWRAED
jgi:hypothetical protein